MVRDLALMPTPAENSQVSGSGIFASLSLAGFVLVWGFAPSFTRGTYYVSRSSNLRSKDRRSKMTDQNLGQSNDKFCQSYIFVSVFSFSPPKTEI
jgi:hypothetical protein